MDDFLILGVDACSTATGWAVVAINCGAPRLLASGVIDAKPKHSPPERLAFLDDKIAEILAIHRPNLLTLEFAFSARFPRAITALAEARGIVKARAFRHGVRIVEVSPMQAKKIATGSGKADKDMVAAGVRKLCPGCPAEFWSSDESDAIAIALTGASHGPVA